MRGAYPSSFFLIKEISYPSLRNRIGRWVRGITPKRKTRLTGEVDWDFKRREPENAVSHVAGVRGVSNLISIKPRDSRRDEIKQAIERAFERNAGIDPRSTEEVGRVEEDRRRCVWGIESSQERETVGPSFQPRAVVWPSSAGRLPRRSLPHRSDSMIKFL